MSQFTKKAIIDAFVELISERPLNKITVKDIVMRCGVNRNTFYYYFEDIYALIDELFQLETEKVIGNEEDYQSWQEAFYKAIDFVYKNKQGVYHLYKSISREQVENYLNRVSYNNILAFAKRETDDLSVDGEDVELIASFYAHALTGIVLDWLGDGMRGNPREYIERLGVLLDGNIRHCFLKNRQTDKDV